MITLLTQKISEVEDSWCPFKEFRKCTVIKIWFKFFQESFTSLQFGILILISKVESNCPEKVEIENIIFRFSFADYANNFILLTYREQIWNRH